VAGRFPWLSQSVTLPPEKHLKRLAPLSVAVCELLIAVAAADEAQDLTLCEAPVSMGLG